MDPALASRSNRANIARSFTSATSSKVDFIKILQAPGFPEFIMQLQEQIKPALSALGLTIVRGGPLDQLLRDVALLSFVTGIQYHCDWHMHEAASEQAQRALRN